MAYEHNPELEAQRARVRQADFQVAEARGNYRPSIGITGSYGYNRNNELGLDGIRIPEGQIQEFTPTVGRATLSQPVLTGGQAYAQVQRAIALVRSARADLLNAEQQILFATAQAYMDTVRDAENFRLHRTDVDILMRQRQATKTQLDAGAATKTDLQEVEVRIAGAQADLAQAESQLAQSRDNSSASSAVHPKRSNNRRPCLICPARRSKRWRWRSSSRRASRGRRRTTRQRSTASTTRSAATLPHVSIQADMTYSKDSLQSPLRRWKRCRRIACKQSDLFRRPRPDLHPALSGRRRIRAHQRGQGTAGPDPRGHCGCRPGDAPSRSRIPGPPSTPPRPASSTTRTA